MQKKRRGKLRVKIVILMSIILAVVCLGLGLVAYNNIYNSLTGNIKEMLPKLAIESARFIETRVSSQFNSLETMALDEKIISFDTVHKENPDIMALLIGDKAQNIKGWRCCINGDAYI